MEREREQMTGGQIELAFDPLIPVGDALGKWWVAVLAALVMGAAAFLYTGSSHVPRYTAQCTLAVYDGAGAASPRLAKAFAQVVGSSVISGIPELEHFAGSIRTDVLEQTNLVTVYAAAGEPEAALAGLRLLLECHGAVTEPVTGGLVLEPVEVPTASDREDAPADPAGAFQKAALGSAGAVFGALVLFYWFRDTIRGPEEAAQKLRCRYLGAVYRRKGTGRDAAIGKLCRRVEVAMTGGGLLLVTEVRSGDGARALAEELARRGLRAEYQQLPDALENLDRADGVLLVLRHDRTPASEVNRAADALGQGKLLGCVCVDFRSTGLFDGEDRAKCWYREVER